MTPARDISRLIEIMAALRTPTTGCPWDLEQDFSTIAPYTIEEAYEVADAIARHDLDDLRDELGDLLLHLAFQLVIGEERGEFDAETVTRALEEKMRRRHPHLFGLGDKPQSWELGKREPGTGHRSVLDGMPATLPPLLMAYRLQERAAGVGFDWPDATGPMQKVKEETAELEAEMRDAGNGMREALQDEIGDLLFAVVNLARKLAIDPRAALEQANDKFTRRFEAVERLAEQRGLDLGRAGLADLDRLWDEVKAG